MPLAKCGVAKVVEDPINGSCLSIHHKTPDALKPVTTTFEETNLKIPIPAFSERYKAHVEAERQYVSRIQQENSPTSGRRSAPSGARGAATSTIEEAFRSVRTENRSNPGSSDGKSDDRKPS